MRTAIVGDTNVYRRIARLEDPAAFLLELVRAEKADGILSFASPVVMMELLVLCNSPDSKTTREYVTAIEALIMHCSEPSGGLRMIAEPTMTTSLILFGRVPSQLRSAQMGFSGLCEDVVSKQCVDAAAFAEISSLRRRWDAQEQGFVDMLVNMQQEWSDSVEGQFDRRDYVAQLGSHFSSEPWLLAYGNMLIDRCCDITGETAPDQRDKFARELSNVSALAISLFEIILRKMLLQGANPERRARNSVWDILLAHSVDNELSVRDRKMILVTDDREFFDAAESSGQKESCMALHKYLTVHRMHDPMPNQPLHADGATRRR